jgi:uncharacterized protein YkwD
MSNRTLPTPAADASTTAAAESPTPTRSTSSRIIAFGFAAALAVPGGSLLRSCEPAPAPPAPMAMVTPECITLLNEKRAEAGVPAVGTHPSTDTAASEQALYQARKQRMTHRGSGGSNAGNRLSATGYAWRTWGENVAAGQDHCSQVIDAWYNSQGHRDNMLNPSFVHVGVAVSRGTNGVAYWSMVLTAP